MAKGSTTKAPAKRKAPVKPESTVTKPIEGGDALPERDEPEFEPPEPADIETLAVQMCLAAGETRPRATIGGVERWKQWEGPARDMLVAFRFISQMGR